MVFTSKTIIPGKEPIGRNKDGSYIYDGVQAPNMSVMPSQGTYDTGKQMSVVPKVWTPPTPVPMVKSPVGFNIMPKVDPVIAAKVNAPIEDIKGILQVDKADPRILKLEQHFKTLKQKGGLQLNQKQTEYVQRYKKNLPQYANVPDALLFGRIIMKYPEAQEKYGNIGDKSLLKRIVGLPLDIAKTGSDAIMEAQNVFDERQKTLNKDGNLGITNLLASAAAGRALGGGVLGMAGDVLNVASPLINPETGVTTITEGLGRDIGTGIEKVPEEYRQEISDLIVKYPKISATLGTAGDLSNLIPFLGVLGKAKNASQVDDILRQVKTRPATKFRGPVSQEVFDAGMNRSVIKDAASVPVKTSAATLRGTAKAGEFTGETAISTAVGLSKPSQQAIKTTPELYKQARTGVLTRDTAADEVVTTLRKRLGELSDTGKEYNTIRNSGVTMPKQDFAKIVDDFFKENDISKIDMPIKDRKVVQQAIDYIAEYDDILTAKNGMSLRRKLDDLADWSTEATGEGKRLIRKLRGKVDEYLGEKLPGLKDLDAKYAPEVSFLRKVKTGVLNADGTIKDSAISYVANIVGKGKEIKLDRLEQLLPGIGSKVRALKAFEEVQAISSMKTGSIARQLGGIVTGSTLGGPIGLVAGFVATNPNIVAFALEKYGMAKNAIKALLKKGAKITPDEAIKVKQAVDATPKEAIATYLLGAGEQRKLLMPPKAGDSIIKRISEGKSPTPSSNSPSVSSVESSKQKLLPMPQKPQVESGISSVLSQLSKEKSKSAGKKVNAPIIQKLAKKQETPKTSANDNSFFEERLAINKKKLEDTNSRLKEINDSTDTTLQGERNNFAEKRTLEIDKKMLEDSISNTEEYLGKGTPKTSNIDPELESLQKQYETLPGVPKVEVPADYIPKDGLPTGTEFEAPIISSISKTKGKLPSPDVKRPQIRGFDLSTRSSMLESLKEQGMFTDSFFVVKDKNVSNKLFEYAEKKAIKKGNPTSGTKVDMKALVERAENGADTLLTPKEYMKLGKENGVYLRMDIGNGNQVAVNASYADIFFKNFDDVTFKGNNELSPVVVLSKGEPVGVIMPIKDVYNLKDKIGDFSMQNKTPQVEGKTKKAQALSQKSEVKYSEPDSLTKEARKYKTADEFYKAQTDPLLELKKLGKVKKGVAEGTVTTAIDDIGGIDNVTRGTTNINKLETTETINTNSLRYKAIKEEVENGNITPIIVDDYLRVMDGHHRLAAYKAMGMTEIPVIAPKMTSGVKRTTFSEYKDIWEQANKSKSSLPMSAKSEVKYSKPDLASEARKYKSADDFVNSKGNLYHGTSYKGEDIKIIPSENKYKNQWGDMMYMTENRNVSSQYGDNLLVANKKQNNFFNLDKKLTDKEIKSIGELLPENERRSFVLEFTSPLGTTPKEGSYIYGYLEHRSKLGRNHFNDVLKEMGYDGVYGASRDSKLGTVYGLFDTKNIKTKQQLIDIYNKANN